MSKELTKKDESLPALPVEFSDEELDGVEDSDFEGDVEEAPMLPFARIRQKDIKDESGKKILKDAGTWVIKDSVTDHELDFEELKGTIIGVTEGRVYFASPEDNAPTCKSSDGVNGSRDGEVIESGDKVFGKYGKCEHCQLSKFKANNERPDCAEVRYLVFHDDIMKGVYIITVGPSAIKEMRKLQEMCRRTARGTVKRVPYFYNRFRLTTDFKSKAMGFKGDYYVPIIEIIGKNDEVVKALFRDQKKALAPKVSKTVETMDVKDIVTGSDDSAERPPDTAGDTWDYGKA